MILLQATPAGGGMSGIFMIVALIVIFYFFMIRPQQKRQKEIRKFREGLSKGDNIVTAGGIYGKICEIRDINIVIEIAQGVKITVDKGSVYPNASVANQAKQQEADNR